MMYREPRPISPLDLPLVRRLITERLPLDTCAALTRGLPGIEEALLSSVPLTDLGAPTVVLRNSDEGYVGQFRLRADRNAAHVTFLAPDTAGGDPHDWAALLEGIAYEAGKRGAHLINAEVSQQHPIFRAFRLAGFAVYSRQVIMRRQPGAVTGGDPSLVRPAEERDSVAISALQTNTVPRLLQQAEEPQPAPDSRGFVYERDGQLAAYLAVSEGKCGVVVKPYFHPEMYDQVAAIVLSTLRQISRAEHVPVYFYARAYQDWLRGILEQVEFETWAHQALMVKYTVVRGGRSQPVTVPDLETNRLTPPVADGPLPMLRKFVPSRWTRYRKHHAESARRNGK